MASNINKRFYGMRGRNFVPYGTVEKHGHQWDLFYNRETGVYIMNRYKVHYDFSDYRPPKFNDEDIIKVESGGKEHHANNFRVVKNLVLMESCLIDSAEFENSFIYPDVISLKF